MPSRFNSAARIALVHKNQSAAERAVIELGLVETVYPLGWGSMVTGRRFDKVIVLFDYRIWPRFQWEWLDHLKRCLPPGSNITDLT